MVTKRAVKNVVGGERADIHKKRQYTATPGGDTTKVSLMLTPVFKLPLILLRMLDWVMVSTSLLKQQPQTGYLSNPDCVWIDEDQIS